MHSKIPHFPKTYPAKALANYLVGWRAYFGYCETPSVLRDLDSWIRRRLRCVQCQQWKVDKRRKAALIRLGVKEELAGHDGVERQRPVESVPYSRGTGRSQHRLL